MKHTYSFNPIAAGIALFFLSSQFSAYAQEASEVSEADVEKIDVLGKKTDYYSIMPDGKNSSAFGLDKSLYETPRSITEIS